MSGKQHLIGAYGMFWDRSAVDWSPGSGRRWQLLGRIGTKRGRLRVCDFRYARGFYVLFNDYGPTYVGLAAGRQGFGQRLTAHTLPAAKQPAEMRHAPKDWSRFCWFSFDDVQQLGDPMDPWVDVELDDNSRDLKVKDATRELESLMILALGIKAQNQMRPLQGERWEQVTLDDCYAGGVLTKVERALVTTPSLATALQDLGETERQG